MKDNSQEPVKVARPFDRARLGERLREAQSEPEKSERQIGEKTFHIKTYGCQMNVYDSVRMKDVLAPLGYRETQDPQEADLLLLNTCHIREKAAEKVYSELGRIRRQREQTGKPALIGVAGCVAQAEGEEMLRRAPYIDMVFGPQSYHLLPEMIRKVQKRSQSVMPPYDDGTRKNQTPSYDGVTGEAAGEGTEINSHEPAKRPTQSTALEKSGDLSGKNKIIELDFPEVQKFDLLPEATQAQGASAFVSVQEGCDKFCTFCVVPYTRGAEYSRPVAKIEQEARTQVAQGAVEITLLGQNVNAYHGEGADGSEWSLGRLIRHLADIDGLERIRYTTSHPRDMHEALYEAHRDLEILMPYLHLPIQSGSDRILKAMNRKHSAADYLAVIDKLRSLRPDMAFSGDFIVGFPGETDADFEATLRLVESVQYASAYSFKYSPRPGTPAAGAGEQVEESVKAERLARLQALLNKQQQQFNEATVGRTLPILPERKGRHAGQLIGKSPYMQSVVIDAPEAWLGRLVEVEITGAHPNSLTGRVVGVALSSVA